VGVAPPPLIGHWQNRAMRINLGSGERPLEGWVNVDALPDAPGVDVVADIVEPLPFDSASADALYASHLLEHVSTDDVPGVLAEWRRVLRPGGVLMIAVPDLEVIARMIVERPGWFTPPHTPWIGAIYGGQKDAWDFHKTGFTAPWLAYCLDQAGFGDVRRVDRFTELRVDDGSYSPIPFGVNVSLNMRAVAGGTGLDAEQLRPTRAEHAFNKLDRLLEHGMTASTRLRSRLMARRRRRLFGIVNR
jgi:predicted SAM-dependent methyltransferase